MKANTYVWHRIPLVVVKHLSIFVCNVRWAFLSFFPIKSILLLLDAPIVRLNGGGVLSEHQRLILTCIVDAYPSVDSYQWFKNDRQINVSPLTSSYIVEKVSKDDTGIYTCQARNTLKYANGTTMERSDKTQTRVTVECKRIAMKRNDCDESIVLFFNLFRCANGQFINTYCCCRIIRIECETSMWNWFLSSVEHRLDIQWSANKQFK